MYLTIIYLTLISALTVGFFGRFFGFYGSAIIATSCLIVAFFISLFIFYEVALVGCASNRIRDFSLIIGIILIFIYCESTTFNVLIERLCLDTTDLANLGWNSLWLFTANKNSFIKNMGEKILKFSCNVYVDLVSELGLIKISYPIVIISFIFGIYQFSHYSLVLAFFVSNLMAFTLSAILLVPISYNLELKNEKLNKFIKLLECYCNPEKFQKFLWVREYLTKKLKKKP